MVLKKRTSCPMPDDVTSILPKKQGGATALKQEEIFEKSKIKGIPSGGYLIGRHPECGESSPSTSLATFAFITNTPDRYRH